MDGAGGGGYPPGHPYAAYGAYGGADQQQQQLQQQQQQQQQPPPPQPQQAQQQLYGNAEAGGYVDPSQAQLYQQQLYQQQAAAAAFGQQGGQQMTQEQMQWLLQQQQLQQQQHQHQLYQQQQAQQQAQQQQLLQQYALQQQQLYQQQQAAQQAQQQAAAQQAAAAMAAHQQQQQAQQQLQQQQQQQAVPGQEQMTPQQQHELQQRQWALQQLQMQQQQQARTEEERRRRAEMQQRQEEALEEMQKQKELDAAAAAQAAAALAAAPVEGEQAAFGQDGAAAAGGLAVAGGVVVYCVCQRTEEECDGGLMIECADGKHGCNGWFHPECEGLMLTEEELEKGSFTCSLCKSGGKARGAGRGRGRGRGPGGRGRGGKRKSGSDEEDGPGEQLIETVTSRGRVRKAKAINFGESDDDGGDEEDDYSDDGRGGGAAVRAARKSAAAFAAQQPGFGTIIGPPPPVNAPFDFTVEKILSWQPYDEEDAEGKEREYRLTGKDFWLVKWKGRSFLHTSWETRDGLLLHDGATDTKIKRYETAMQKVRGPLWREQLLEEMKERKGPELPDAELTEVQRVLSCETAFAPIAAVARQVRRQRHALWLDEQAEAGADPEQAAAAAAAALEQAQASRSQLEQEEDAAHDQVRYLVKWRGLSYHEATWEKWADIKEWAYEEVAQFWLVQRPEAKLNREQGSAWGAANVQALQDMSNPKFGFRTRSFLSVYDPYGPSDLNQTEADGGPLELRDYQLTGLKWLMFNCIQRRPSILADEMGLGKTIQTMAFLTQLYHTPGGAQRGPFLVVAPLSLVTQWQAEAQTWAPDLNVLVYHGNTEARQVIRDYEFYFCEPYIAAADAHYLKQHSIVKFDILLTTYETVIKDIKFLQQIHWKCLVVDEAHRLKNPSSRLFTELRQLPRGHTVLLTGTPLQNKTEELWALLNFADPVAFADQAAFLQQYGELKEAAQVESLHNMLKPFLLRRIKEDVEKSLPPKEETVVEVSLTPLQRKFYMAIYDRNTAFLFKESKPSMAPSLMNVMMELRKCCNHAYLNRGVEERILSEIPPEQRTPETLHTQLVACSGKLVLLDKLLPRLKTEGHKVLIFSQMVRVLDLVEDYLRYQGYLYERLDGSKRASERSAAVVRFNNPALNRFIMLLSTRAGGLGLNLTAADTVIIYDSDWNPHNDLQAQARAHRIGQTKAVKVYRLLTRKSYEVEMFHTASMKLGLDRAMLAHTRAEDAVGGGGDGMLKATGGKPSMELTHTEVEHLLKRGAYDVFRGDDKEGQEFQEADLDQILQRQSHNVTYEKSGAATGLGSSFAKASFVSVDKKEDIDLDDPDFWRKAIGLKEPPKETAAISKLGGTSFFGNVLAPGEKRKRKRNERFDPSGLAALAGEGFEDSPFEDDGEDDSDDESGDKSYSSGEPRRRGRPRKGELRGSAGRGGRGKRGRQPSGLGLNGATDGGPPRKPMKWGPHSRDRVIRALLEFGFGRWERIRQEGNALDATASEIESFCRSYVLQCGLCAGQGKRGKNETKFVKDAIAAASKLAAQMASGEIVLPEVLKDDKFLAKLRGGLARKALVRLDVLLRLQTPLMNEAVRLAMAGMGPAALAAKGVKPEDMAALGFEERFALLDLGEVAARLPLGDVRPTWTRITPWWDDECDKHLLVGVYAHGYLAYNAIRDDPTLCFGRKLRAWLEKHPGGVGAGAGAGAADALAALPMPKEQVLGVDATWDPLLVILRLPKRRDGRGGDGGAATGKKEAEGEASAAPASAEQAVAAIEAAEQPKQSPMSTTEEGEADGAAVKMEEDGAPSKPEPGAEAGAGADKPAAKEEQPPPPQQQSFYLRAVTFPGKRTSTFKGVYAQPGSWHWAAQVLHPAGPKCVSFCLDEEEAARAYDKEARDLFGPDAVCNFLLSGERNPALPPVKPGESPPLVWNRSSRYRGVRAAGSKWTAQCSLGGASRHLGTFATELEAALAYDLATQKNHPEGLPQAVVLNFPDGMEAELAALDARMAALTAGALPGGWASAAAAQEAAGVAAATIAQAEAEGKLDGADGPISLVPAPAAVAAVAAAAAAGVKAEAVAVKKEEEQTETAVEAPATAAEAERPPSSAATGTQTSSASTPQPPEDQEAASASASASKDEAQPPQPPAAPADEEKEQGQGVEGDASEPSPAPAASKAEAADGGVAEQKTAEGEGNGEGEAKPVPAPEQEQEQEQEQAKEGGGGSEGNLIPAASSTSLAASTAASLDVVVVEDTAEEDEDDEMMDIGGKDEEDGASSAKADGGSEAGGAAGAGAEGAGAKAASSTSTAGPKVVDELLRKHWPDNSKVLCKLVGWLIDDPEARLTLREVRAQEEERLAKRLEEERVRRELLARAKRARAEVELRRAQHQQQGGKRKESVDGGGGISLSGGSAEDLKRLRGGEKWSLDECRRLCNALLISGAPLASPPLPVATALAAAVGLGPASLKPPPAGVPLPEGVAGYLPTFTWNDLTQRAGLHLHPARGADEVALFYATELLPLFQRLCAHRGPLAEGETGSHIPDPSRPVSEHSQGARSIAYTFMRRQQVCRATRFILEKELPRLAELLEAQARAQAERQGQGQGQASSGLPSWWRPQQHDLALMVAGWAHGILNVEQARRWEPGFCLSDGPLRAHVAAALKEQQRQQLQAAAKDGVEVVEDAAGAVLEPDDAAIAVALAAFPERKTIEERLQRICLAISNRGPSGGGGGRHEDGGGGDGNGGGGVGRSASGEGMLGASGSSLSGLGSGAQLSLASPPSQQLLQHSNGEGSGGGGHGGGGLGGAPMMATTLPFKLSPAGTLIVNRGGMGSRLTTIAPAPSGAAGPGMVVQQMQVGFTTAGGGHVAVAVPAASAPAQQQPEVVEIVDDDDDEEGAPAPAQQQHEEEEEEAGVASAGAEIAAAAAPSSGVAVAPAAEGQQQPPPQPMEEES